MELPVKKGHCLPKMSTRAKRKVVAGDRARRPNVPWHMPPGVRVRENVVANTDKKKYTKQIPDITKCIINWCSSSSNYN